MEKILIIIYGLIVLGLLVCWICNSRWPKMSTNNKSWVRERRRQNLFEIIVVIFWPTVLIYALVVWIFNKRNKGA